MSRSPSGVNYEYSSKFKTGAAREIGIRNGSTRPGVKLSGLAARLVRFGANNGSFVAIFRDRYSITSSARASNVGDTVRPSALAVRRLMTN